MKTERNGTFFFIKFSWVVCLGVLLLFLQACKSEETELTTTTDTTSTSISTPSLELSFPDTLTGGSTSSASVAPGEVNYAESDGPNCNFDGNGDDNDPFKNGQNMSRFLISMTATWMCFGDWMMTNVMAMGWPVDGVIQTIPEDADDPDSPTGISITQDSDTQTTIRLYWEDDTTTPGMFISWNTDSGTTTGKMVLGSVFMGDDDSSDSPDEMRMDFTVSATEQIADMFLAFPDAASAFTGFRTEVTKDLADNSFIARAKMDMKAQYSSDATMDTLITETPVYQVFTVADSTGAGAALAEMSDIGWGLDLSGSSLGHIGYYLFTKTDTFFFNASGVSEYVNKVISSATYEGARTSTTGNLDTIEAALSLSADYYTDTCNDTTTDCSAMIEALFSNSDFGQEQNSGTDPGDSRSTAITSPSYLSSVYPTGSSSWDGVFDMSFTP